MTYWTSPGPQLVIFQNMGSMDVTYVDIEIDKIHDVSIRQTKHVNKVDTIVKLSIINTN